MLQWIKKLATTGAIKLIKLKIGNIGEHLRMKH